MELLQQVTKLCARLAPGGWHSLLLAHGLDITAVPLGTELIKPLNIDRSLRGFEDFASTGNRAIEPGQPAYSLLYHALASPEVTHDQTGQPLRLFPTPAEIETVLNFVYATNRSSLQRLRKQAGDNPMAVVVFASEYRNAAQTVHSEHADLCFSRTGIARVGTAPCRYDAPLRSFLPLVDDDPYGIRVMPVRYSAYIAMQLKGDPKRFGPMDAQPGDAELDFWVPMHKLFNGSQCLVGLNLTLDLDNHQINEKLRHIHRSYTGTGWQEPQISQPPFVVTDNLAHWATPQDMGLGLLLPNATPKLVEAASLEGQPLSFWMPRGTGGMVHGRHTLDEEGRFEDLNDREGVAELVKQGGYRALHYHDNTADGWVRARCPALQKLLPSIAAYSVIGAPDFFPLCNQRQLLRWASTEPDPNIWHARLEALSNVRYCANLSLKQQPFSANDLGVTAIVGLPHRAKSKSSPSKNHPVVDRPSSLPDAAAGIFGPGWEVGRYPPFGSGPFSLSGYQMASPFTEDVRICAALASYWPGVAPDSARTFEPRSNLHSIIPLTDEEIGQHGATAWDNQQGPQLIAHEGRMIARYRAYEYTDYTRVALDGRFSLHLTGRITQRQYQDRVRSMRRVYNVLEAGSDPVLRKDWPLLSFRLIHRPDAELATAEQESGLTLAGWIHRFHVYKRGADWTPQNDFKLRYVDIERQVTLLISEQAMLIRYGQLPWQIALEAL
jgi:hypothetical protein